MYIIRDREAGNELARFNTYHEAEHQLFAWEHEDKCNGEYTEDFYEIVERRMKNDNQINA